MQRHKFTTEITNDFDTISTVDDKIVISYNEGIKYYYNRAEARKHVEDMAAELGLEVVEPVRDISCEEAREIADAIREQVARFTGVVYESD